MEDGKESVQAFRLVYLVRTVDEVVDRYLTRLCRLRDEGFEVHVLAGAGPGFRELADQGIMARKIPVRKASNIAGLLGSYFIIQAHLLEARPVLVHSFGHRLAWQASFAARQAGVPAVFSTLDYHWLDEDPLHFPLGPLATRGTPKVVERVERGLNAFVGAPYRISMRRAYGWLAEAVDRYLVTTEFDFQLLQDMGIVEAKKLEMVIGGAGVDLERFQLPEQGDPKREEARRTLGLPGHWRQVVGYVGPLTRSDGADDLVAAIRALRQTHPSVGWLVVGRGEMASGQMRRLRRLEGEGDIKLIDDRRVDSEHYRAMDVFAFCGRPSTRHDGIVEAAALAVPTVTYDTPAGRSLVEEGQTGRLLFDESGPALAAGLARLLNDPRYARELGWRARSRAGQRFSRRAVDDQVLRLYDRVLDKAMSIGESR